MDNNNNNDNGLINNEKNQNPADKFDKDNELDAKIAKSIEKLVEEETNVARAFVNGDHTDPFSIYENKQQQDILHQVQSEQSASMKTQVIPDLSGKVNDSLDDTRVIGDIQYTQNMNDKQSMRNIQDTQYVSGVQNTQNNPNVQNTQYIPNAHNVQNQQYTQNVRNTQNTQHIPDTEYTQNTGNDQGKVQFPYQQNGSTQQKATQTNRENQSFVRQNMNNQEIQNNENIKNKNHPIDKTAKDKPKTTKKKKLIIAGIVAVAVIVIGIIVAVFVSINNKNKQSFKYNYNRGMEKYDAEEYKEAIPYLKKAFDTSDGKKNVNLMLALADSYQNVKQMKDAIDTIKALLSYDKNNEKGLKALGQLYVDEDDGEALTELIYKYKDTKGEEYLKEFRVTEPYASEDEGTYDHDIKISLTSDDATDIYYTTDGKEPNKTSSRYTNPIEIEKGTTELKAVAINDIGTTSYVASYKYVVEYKQPDAPDINPVSGSYSVGQKISIDNLKDSDTAYYTLDGTDPSTSSTKYTGEFDMPSGNVVVSAIIINEYDMTSSVTRRNYVVKEEKSYTFDEAVDILKNRMISLNALKSDGKYTSDGGEVTFVYQSKKTIDGTEMYLIRMDEKKNGSTSMKGYFGVGTKSGQCYKVTESGAGYSASSY